MPPPKEESNDWIWIVMFVLVALVGGGLVVFGIQRSRANGDEEEERPRKKGVKKRVRAEED